MEPLFQEPGRPKGPYGRKRPSGDATWRRSPHTGSAPPGLSAAATLANSRMGRKATGNYRLLWHPFGRQHPRILQAWLRSKSIGERTCAEIEEGVFEGEEISKPGF